jgi:copper chaperone CopZ
MGEIVLEVPDISCEHCARAINRRLAPLAGVRRIELAVPGKRVRVEYDEAQADRGAVRDALAAEGYPVAGGA